MANTYVFIDYENVQPKNLDLVSGHDIEVLAFIGANQVRLQRDVVVAMQNLGKRASYIEIEGSGPNALDFHIAYYIGELAASNKGASFNIVSKDRGFDPLIRHLKSRRISVRRFKDIAEIPELRVPRSAGKDEQVQAIVTNLRNRGQSRPRKIRTLANTIGNLINGLDNKEVAALIEELKRRKVIVVKNDNVTYRLKGK